MIRLRARRLAIDEQARHERGDGSLQHHEHHAMRWMQRLKRAFRIDIETCQRCGGKLRVIASIEDPELIRRILEHLEGRKSTEASTPPARAPPPAASPA